MNIDVQGLDVRCIHKQVKILRLVEIVGDLPRPQLSPLVKWCSGHAGAKNSVLVDKYFNVWSPRSPKAPSLNKLDDKHSNWSVVERTIVPQYASTLVCDQGEYLQDTRLGWEGHGRSRDGLLQATKESRKSLRPGIAVIGRPMASMLKSMKGCLTIEIETALNGGSLGTNGFRITLTWPTKDTLVTRTSNDSPAVDSARNCGVRRIAD
eukprot:scaffold4066_cov417-Prasinococcus_capsulatus_cf.AAC.11